MMMDWLPDKLRAGQKAGNPPPAPEPSLCRDLSVPAQPQAHVRAVACSPRQARRMIADSGALEMLLEYVAGKREMELAKANILMGLVKKIVPDLSPVSLPADEEESDEAGSASPNVIEFRIVDPKR